MSTQDTCNTLRSDLSGKRYCPNKAVVPVPFYQEPYNKICRVCADRKAASIISSREFAPLVWALKHLERI